MSAKKQDKLREDVRTLFRQNYKFFTDAVKSWPFFKRLAFCRDVMLKRI